MRPKWLWPAIVAARVIAAEAGLILWGPWRPAPRGQAVRFEVGKSEKATFINQAAMAISPDGRWMSFIARDDDGQVRYHLRALDGVEVRALPGREGAYTPEPAWSTTAAGCCLPTGKARS